MWATAKSCWAALAMVTAIPSRLGTVCMIMPCGMVLQPCVHQEHGEMVMEMPWPGVLCQ